MESTNIQPVAVLGAGPVGLAAAAHLLARGLEPVIFEASDSVGASFRDFAHVKLFSPWRYNIDRAGRELLEAHGWVMPPEETVPTAGEFLQRYLRPLAALPPIAGRLRLHSRVVGVARQGFDKVKSEGRASAPFVIRVEHGSTVTDHLAAAVIDATGNWSSPNPLGANGLPAIGEERLHCSFLTIGTLAFPSAWGSACPVPSRACSADATGFVPSCSSVVTWRDAEGLSCRRRPGGPHCC